MAKKPPDSINEIIALWLEAVADATDRAMLGPARAEIDGRPVKGVVRFKISRAERAAPSDTYPDAWSAAQIEEAMWATVGIDIFGEEEA